MSSIREKIREALGLYHSEFKARVLKTVEEVEANKDSDYLVAAPVVGEIFKNFGGIQFYEDESGNKYAVGADAVPKKLGSGESSLVFYHTQANGNPVTSSYTCPEDGIYHIFAYAISGGAASVHTVSYNFSCNGTLVSSVNLANTSTNTYISRMYYYCYNCKAGNAIAFARTAKDSNQGNGRSGIFIVH